MSCFKGLFKIKIKNFDVFKYFKWIINLGALMEKRKSAYMRFGRSLSSPIDNDIGFDDINEMDHFKEKRKSAYMRYNFKKKTHHRDRVY